MEKCHPEIITLRDTVRAEEAATKGESISSFVVYGGSFFQEFLKWTIYTYQPVNTCENPYFRKMCYELNTKVSNLQKCTLFLVYLIALTSHYHMPTSLSLMAGSVL